MQHHGLLLITCVLFMHLLPLNSVSAAEGKTTYAVVNLKPGDGVSEGESELITDRLRTELFKTGKVSMMERNQMQDILKEQGFQQSGACTDEACLVEMGQMLGVKIMVIGSLGKLGSMFMINIRAIDVQTAQVVKVVSVDVKGDIEEVVDHLSKIAVKITGDQKLAEAPPEPTVAAPLPEPENETPPPQPVAEAPAPSPLEVAPEETDAVVKKAYETPDKNKNRSGVGFTFNFFGEPSHIITSDSLDSDDYEGIFLINPNTGNFLLVDDVDYEKTASLFVDYLIRFYIRAGKYINIEIGPHIMIGTETYVYSGANSDFFEAEFFSSYYIPGVHLGIDFVKRFYPLKINVGVFGNISIPIIYYSLDYSNYSTSDYFYEESTTPFMRLIPGFRTGAEILLGNHFGFSADFVFQAIQFEFDYDFDEWDEGNFKYNSTDATNNTQEVQFLKVGLAISANIYF